MSKFKNSGLFIDTHSSSRGFWEGLLTPAMLQAGVLWSPWGCLELVRDEQRSQQSPHREKRAPQDSGTWRDDAGEKQHWWKGTEGLHGATDRSHFKGWAGAGPWGAEHKRGVLGLAYGGGSSPDWEWEVWNSTVQERRVQGLARPGNVQQWGRRYWLGGEHKISYSATLVLGGVCVCACACLQVCVTQVCDFVWRPKVEDRNFPKSLSHLVLSRQGILLGSLSRASYLSHLPWNCHIHPAFTWVLGILSKLQCPCLWGECFNYWETFSELRPWKLWLVRLSSLYFIPLAVNEIFIVRKYT